MPSSPDVAPGPSGLRRATAADLPEIKAVIDAAYTRYLTRMDKPPAPMLRDYGPSVEEGTTWVAGSPLTAVLTLYPRPGHLYVESIAIHPDAQGRGLGRALMSFAEQEATRLGLTRMALVTHEVMTENQAIYARLGYVEVDRQAEDGYRRIFMEKQLSEFSPLITTLSLEEKVRLLTGRDIWSTVPLQRIGLRSITLSDGPSGVRGPRWDERDPSLSLPSATALAAAWSPGLAAEYAAVAAAEARRKGVDVVLGPTINLHRSPLGGRHFEAFSEDPLLTGRLAAAYVAALQERGVGATPKHYVANDFETDRFTADVQVSDRALREVYLAPFEEAVTAARAWLVMSAYNSVNGATASENELLETPLNSEWGFDGVVVSDWGGVRSTEAARHAQDLAMPGPGGAWGDALAAAVRSGDIPEAAIDRKVSRLLRLARRVGALGDARPAAVAPLEPAAAAAFGRRAAALGTVLVRNDGILPLPPESVARIAVIGHSASAARIQGGGSATVLPERVVSPLDGVRAAYPDAEVSYAPGAIVQQGVAGLPAAELVNPATGEPGIRVRFLDAAGAEIWAEDRRATSLTWLGGDAPVSRLARLEIDTTWTPGQTGRVRLGFAGVGRGIITAGGQVLLDETAAADGADLGAALLSPPSRTAPVDVVAGVPVVLTASFERPAAQAGFGALSFRLGTEPSGDAQELIDEATVAAAAADAVVLVVGTSSDVESEGFDRASLALPGRQDDLARAVLAVNPRTIVVVNSGAPVELPWREDAAAILLGWFGGQEAGHALGDVLTGAAEPGGRLPTTWP
ncbi:MAG TPA: GNAT family N-acetyltransferase, partial [Streptosporangiaceae bacterium]|nr:GNAT family N-acetyltransferase [Streptosporangiaceae bacterium]